MTEATVPLWFGWVMYRPDQRQYRQNSIELYPRLHLNATDEDKYDVGQPPMVRVDIPLKADFIVNAEEISIAQMSNQKAPPLVLTMAGMRYVQDQFDSVLYDTETKPETESWDEDKSEKPATTGKDDWASFGNGKSSSAAKSSSDDDKWDEADTDTKDETWDEDWGE